MASIAVSHVRKALVDRGLPMVIAANPHAAVAKWVLGCSGVVAGIVHVGGVTRLTKSGLSMTDWKIQGSLPPITAEEWQVEFDRYKSYPEWQQRRSMSVEEFRRIYYWEWGHRMLGRFAGVCFAVPWAYFAIRKRIPAGYGPRLAGLFALGGGQGLVGWWMVSSGLGDDRKGDRNEIRVSPYRLATHLSVAFVTYSGLVWTGMNILQLPNSAGAAKSKLADMARSLSRETSRHARSLRGGALAVTALTFATAVSGAFVAGNDAGNAYNTFPKMDGRWVPVDDMFDDDVFPLYRNVFENTAFVQWNHRVLACTTAFSALVLTSVGLFHPASRAAITPQVRRGLQLVGGVTTFQVTLGITTLLNYVPISMAAAHQLGSLALLTSGTYLVHSMRYASPSVMRIATKEISKNAGTKIVALPKIV